MKIILISKSRSDFEKVAALSELLTEFRLSHWSIRNSGLLRAPQQMQLSQSSSAFYWVFPSIFFGCGRYGFRSRKITGTDRVETTGSAESASEKTFPGKIMPTESSDVLCQLLRARELEPVARCVLRACARAQTRCALRFVSSRAISCSCCCVSSR